MKYKNKYSISLNTVTTRHQNQLFIARYMYIIENDFFIKIFIDNIHKEFVKKKNINCSFLEQILSLSDGRVSFRYRFKQNVYMKADALENILWDSEYIPFNIPNMYWLLSMHMKNVLYSIDFKYKEKLFVHFSPLYLLIIKFLVDGELTCNLSLPPSIPRRFCIT